MKLEINEGCTSSSLTVDDKDWEDYSTEEQDSIYEILVNKLTTQQSKEGIIRTLVETFGDYEYDDYTCEQCGHTGSTTTLEL